MHDTIKLETALMPAYYKEFHCLASACQDTCCAGWKIEFNKKDYLAIKRAARTDELKQKLSEGMPRLREREHDNMYAEFSMDTAGKCHLLREDGLCALQLECGPDTLPRVCRIFPRKEVYTAHAREFSLSPACEGVLALLWELPEGVDFTSDPLPEKERYWAFPKRDSDIAAIHFQEIRSLCIDLLQDRRFPLAERIMMVGLALKPLAEGESDFSRWLAQVRALPGTAQAAGLLAGVERGKALPLFLTNAVTVLFSPKNRGNDTLPLRIAAALWLDMGSEGDTRRLLAGPYLTAQARFDKQFAGREYFMENLAVALFFHQGLPDMNGPEELWRSYLNFCNLYSIYRFAAVMSCREGAPGDRDELFRLLVHVSRALLHSRERQVDLQDSLFQNDSATLAHMAVLLSGSL